MAELEQAQRHELERQAFAAAIESEPRGQSYAFRLTLAAMVGAVILGVAGQPLLGGALIAAPMLTLIGSFLAGHLPISRPPKRGGPPGD